MRDGFQKLLPLGISLALVAGLGASPVAAQDEVTPAVATGNADRVDGRHAIKSSGSPAQRKGRLMAFSAKGYLPNNVIKKALDADKLDGLDSAAFATLAALQSPAGAVNEPDNPVHWNQLQGVPGGFADGVDSEGVTGVKLTRVLGTSQAIVGGATPPNELAGNATCPAGSKVTGGGASTGSRYMNITSSYPIDGETWRVYVTNTGPNNYPFTPYAICMSVEPAGAFSVAKKGLLPASVKKDMKKRGR